MVLTIDLTPRAEKQIDRLDPAVRDRVLLFVKNRLRPAADPAQLGKPLSGTFAGLYRFRVGDYRIIAKIERQKLIIIVVDVDHRSRVYR